MSLFPRASFGATAVQIRQVPDAGRTLTLFSSCFGQNCRRHDRSLQNFSNICGKSTELVDIFQWKHIFYTFQQQMRVLREKQLLICIQKKGIFAATMHP